MAAQTIDRLSSVLPDLNQLSLSLEAGPLAASTTWGGGENITHTWVESDYDVLKHRRRTTQALANSVSSLSELEVPPSECRRQLVEDLETIAEATRHYSQTLKDGFGVPNQFGILTGPKVADDLTPLLNVEMQVARAIRSLTEL